VGLELAQQLHFAEGGHVEAAPAPLRAGAAGTGVDALDGDRGSRLFVDGLEDGAEGPPSQDDAAVVAVHVFGWGEVAID
jgi:hypothetical protein